MNNIEKKDIVLFEKKDECCGCGACYAICPQNAIIMDEDEFGFLYPKIDRTKCIKCCRCIQICIFK